MAGIDKTYVTTWKDYKEIYDWAKSIGTVKDDYGNLLTPFNWLYYPDLTEEEFYNNQKRCWEEAKDRYNKYKDSEISHEKESYNYMLETYGEDFLEHPELFYEVVIWNTNTIEDIYLIRHCSLEVIQNRLKQQYGRGWSKTALTYHNESSMYDQIKNYTSCYDTYVRPDNKYPKFTIKFITNDSFKDDNVWWWINIKTSDKEYWNYHETENEWHNDLECYYGKSNWISNICDKFHGQISERKIYRILRHWNLPHGTIVHFIGDFHGKTIQDFTVIVK